MNDVVGFIARDDEFHSAAEVDAELQTTNGEGSKTQENEYARDEVGILPVGYELIVRVFEYPHVSIPWRRAMRLYESESFASMMRYQPYLIDARRSMIR